MYIVELEHQIFVDKETAQDLLNKRKDEIEFLIEAVKEGTIKINDINEEEDL
tara:strand:+ start:692 stop:847 length:156 start_codon:yes stop_codon:yes gene_type:complete